MRVRARHGLDGRALECSVVEVAVLIPVKDFRQAKARLASAVDPVDRAALARWMADRVLAAADRPVFVVCDSDEVATWAQSRGATVLWTPGIGLNAAAADGVTAIAAAGFDHVVVAHSDLPLATDLAGLARRDVVTFVPDVRCDGTNVLALPTSAFADSPGTSGPGAGTAGADGRGATSAVPGFRFAYGPGSFQAHRAEVQRLGLASEVHHDSPLRLDVDTVEDMCHPLIAPLINEVLPTWTPPTSPVSHR
jgi:2-phospho-L-lactate/phosphoenolpyruvate guanylyltransferase